MDVVSAKEILPVVVLVRLYTLSMGCDPVHLQIRTRGVKLTMETDLMALKDTGHAGAAIYNGKSPSFLF